MADEIDESAETFSGDAWCPYCDKLRRYDRDGMILKTCGDRKCHAKAISVMAQERNARRENELHAPSFSMHIDEIDFQNGFDSQNLTFAEDYARLRAQRS